MDAAPPPDALLDALKTALADGADHRLFRAGKLDGLFPSRAGTSADAALFALRDGLLETVRSESKGKVVTEWVRATPKAVAFVHDHDSPKAVLRELRDVLSAARSSVPSLVADTRAEVASLAARFDERADAMLKRLDDLSARVEAALRRAEASATVGGGVGRVVPWAVDALEYLDRRSAAGAGGDCPLPELFHAVRAAAPALTLPAFQDGVRRLHDSRAVRLTGSMTAPMAEPEYAVVADGRLGYWVSR